MGRFWEQPGRERLRDLYRDEVMRPPGDGFGDVEFARYEPGLRGTRSGEGIAEGGVVMGKRMKLGELEGYWRTFSAFHGWQRENQERGSCQTADQNQARALLPISIRNRGISNLPHRALSNCDIHQFYSQPHDTYSHSELFFE